LHKKNKLLLYIYTFALKLYEFLLHLAGSFNQKAQLMLAGRKGVFEQLHKDLVANTSPVVWFHCASLGEFEQGRPVIEAFGQAYPNYKIVLTFFSPSGYEVRKKYAGAHYIYYLPFDSAKNAYKIFDIVKPKLVVFVKYEFWYYYLNEARKRKIASYCISAIFREKQLFFSPFGGFFRKILQNFEHLFVQDRASEQLLKNIAINNVTISGDTRFDRVASLPEYAQKYDITEAFCKNQKIWVIGSCWQADFDFLLAMFNDNSLNYRYIVVPHDIDKGTIRSWQKALHGRSVLYSEAKAEQIAEHKVLIIDNVGMLSSLYAYARYVWVGGAFGKGLHNILEAATYGVPVFFGNKNYQKFKEATDLTSMATAFSCGDFEFFKQKLTSIEKSDEIYRQIGQKNRQYVLENQGATAHIMNFIKNSQL
jgi:3-deoxy-D-manno-octulosonic-acid transferase